LHGTTKSGVLRLLHQCVERWAHAALMLFRLLYRLPQVLMKDAKTGKKVIFVPLLSSPSMADSTDPGFIAAVQSNGGRNDIVIQRM